MLVPSPRLCPQCCEPFEAAGRTRVYCSDACRCRAAYQRSKTGATPSYERVCAQCDRAFATASAGELVCSDGCRRARDNAREMRRLREPRRNLYARERNARWARAHRGVSSSNAWLAGAPPFAAHLPGASMTMGFDPLPRWPVELRNTRGLHGLDLDHGPATGVRAAFERAAARRYAAWEADAAKSHTPLASLPTWWRPVRCARALMSAAELAREGRDMRHCVGTYAGYVRTRKSVIVSLAVRGRGGELYRSTAEIDRQTREVRQHRGAGNEEPPALCVAALRVCLRRWAGGRAT